MKSLFCIFSLVLLANSSWAQHVLFGERDLQKHAQDLFFDKDGIFYPPIYIADDSLRACGNSLTNWYKKHENICDSLLRSVAQDPVISGPIEAKIEALNAALLIQHAEKLTDSSGPVLVAIHGFRKSFFQQNQDVTSAKEFELLDADLSRHALNASKKVHVYWDAMYDCCFSTNLKRNKELFALFDTAMTQADRVGAALGIFLRACKQPKINLIAHSLGTQVALRSLEQWNTEQVVRVAFLAASIPGSDLSDAILDKRLSNKIQWLVYFNENDFVLHKKDPKLGLIGPGAYKHGITTLGSNKRNDAVRTQKIIAQYDPQIRFLLLNAQNVGKCHSLRCYTKEQFLVPMVVFFNG